MRKSAPYCFPPPKKKKKIQAPVHRERKKGEGVVGEQKRSCTKHQSALPLFSTLGGVFGKGGKGSKDVTHALCAEQQKKRHPLHPCARCTQKSPRAATHGGRGCLLPSHQTDVGGAHLTHAMSLWRMYMHLLNPPFAHQHCT